MKFLRKLGALFFCFVFFTGVFQAHAAFNDVPPTHEHYVAIRFLFNKGIMKGYSAVDFKPWQLTTRAEALKVILENSHIEKAQSWDSLPFTDITGEDWETPYVVAAYKKGILTGNPEGKFFPQRTITTAEFIKMLLMANNFVADNWTNKQLFTDVPSDAWFAPFMNYAGHAGIVSKDDNNNVYPLRVLSRADVAEILYLLTIIQNGKDTNFLLNQSQLQMTQISVYINSGDLKAAKRASELGVDLTQQAYKNNPNDAKILGEAKLAKAYHFMLMSFISAFQNDKEQALDLANQAIAKATEAVGVNPALESEAEVIKDKATEIIQQVGSI